MNNVSDYRTLSKYISLLTRGCVNSNAVTDSTVPFYRTLYLSIKALNLKLEGMDCVYSVKNT